MVSGESKFIAFIGYMPLVGFILALLLKKHDGFVMFHAKQGLVWLAAAIIVWLIGSVVGIIPFLGTIISIALRIVLVVLFIIGIINALTGKEKPLPLIGGFARMINV